jgi:hypothetical protein
VYVCVIRVLKICSKGSVGWLMLCVCVIVYVCMCDFCVIFVSKICSAGVVGWLMLCVCVIAFVTYRKYALRP